MPVKNARLMFDGRADLTGQQIGTLAVDSMVARRPEPRYACRCSQCGTEQTAMHSRLRNGSAKCLNQTCGKQAQRRVSMPDERQQAAYRRADELRIAEQEAAALRMDAQTQDYQRPAKYAPTPDHVVMTDRDRRALHDRRDQEEAEERDAAEMQNAEDERRERLRAYWAQAVQDAPDPRFFVSDAMRTADMPTKKAEAFTAAEALKFVAETPEYLGYKSDATADAIQAYLRRNGVHIADAETFRAAFVRLRDLGVIAKNPTPTAPVKKVNFNVSSPAKAKEPTGLKTYIGRDYMTGAERTFTEREVNRMSSQEYKRAFGVIDTVSELFTRINDERN